VYMMLKETNNIGSQNIHHLASLNLLAVTYTHMRPYF
jgi:hypothetical protein